MALSAKVGSFALNTVTGNQAITGVGFQPKLVILFGIRVTADGNAVSCEKMFGVGISSTDRRATMSSSVDAVTPQQARRGMDNTRCIAYNNAATAEGVADFVSQDADGFTINITAAPTSGWIVNYLALGGADLTNVSDIAFAMPTVAGNAAFTGFGFAPDAFWLHALAGTTENAALGSSTHRPCLGWASGLTSRGALGFLHTNGGAAADTSRRQGTNRCFIQPTGGAVRSDADIVSFDADGATLNWVTVGGVADFVYGLGFKGGTFKAGSFTSSTGVGNTGVTGVGFTPVAIVLMSFANIAAAGTIVSARGGFGVASSATARATIANGDTDAANPSVVDSRLDRTKMLTMLTEGTPTVTDEYDLVSFDADGFTYNHVTAGGVAHEILYFAFGSTGVPQPDTVEGMPRFVRRPAFG